MALTTELRTRIERHPEWYHTLDLGPGLLTPGWFDTRPLLERIPFPADLSGARCLDVATFDGFWAFTMEQRGAAEVVAIDLLDERTWDWPVRARPEAHETIGKRKGRGEGFAMAREALGSSVERHDRSVYDLDPEVDGVFDFVYVGSLLLHLKDPVRALEAVRSVTRGRMLLVDAIDLPLSLLRPNSPMAGLDGVGRPWWWKPNRAGLVRMVEAAGFDVAEPPVPVRIAGGAGQPAPGPVATLGALRSRQGRENVFQARFGDPHLAVLTTPA